MTEIILVILVLVLAAVLYVSWQLRHELTKQRSSATALTVSLNEQQDKLKVLEQSLTDNEEAANRLRAALADHEGTIHSLQAALAEREQSLASIQTALDERRSEFERLQAELTEQRTVDHEKDRKIALALTLANSAYEALIVLNERFEVIGINNSAEDLFGKQRPIGEPLESVVQSPEIRMMVEEALERSEELLEEQHSIDKCVYRVRAQVIKRDGNTFIGLALQDVTQLVRLNRARREMVANISHELRTPIANIRLIIDGLFLDQDKPKRKQSNTALRSIARETESLLWLAQELLDLSMIETGQAIMRLVDVPVAELVNEAYERLADQIEAKNIKLKAKSIQNIQALCDRDQARRVLINLIHNAIKWSPEDETITVRAEAGDDEVTFTVLDNGPGVDEEAKERIFERFYQVDPARSGGEGSGLGLAICKHIVEAHGGRIWAEGNGNGGGGCFKFTLPISDTLVNQEENAELGRENGHQSG